MTYPVCPHCRQRIINPGGHAEACTGPWLSERGKGDKPLASPAAMRDRDGLRPRSESPVQVELAPDHEIDPTTQVDRTPGVDAICQKVGVGGYAPDCGFPFCDCFVRGGS